MTTSKANPECKRCGLLLSTVMAIGKKCIPDKRMGIILQGLHDFPFDSGYDLEKEYAQKSPMTTPNKCDKCKHGCMYPATSLETPCPCECHKAAPNDESDGFKDERHRALYKGMGIINHGYGTPAQDDTSIEKHWNDIGESGDVQDGDKRKELIDFLKGILPYWESEDLDDYMYIVHHYDLERVAAKLQGLISRVLKEERTRVMGMAKEQLVVTDGTDEYEHPERYQFYKGYNQALSDFIARFGSDKE